MVSQNNVRLIAFYLPQFHPIPQNDEWWGKGFTEWSNVSRARPVYPGHMQPRLPGELGFYDLRLPEISVSQAQLAREYGIAGFCYYYYWFSPEKQLLERPLNQMLASGEPDFPFCLCWANENWTRRWDGSEKDLLVKQEYTDEVAEQFIESLLPSFRDDRYIRIDGKPVLLVYDTRQLQDPRKSTALWRRLVRDAGFDDVYLIRCNTFVTTGLEVNPINQGFDACVEFPPHGVSSPQVPLLDELDETGKNPCIYDYESIVFKSVNRQEPGFELYRGLFPSWDNTPRKPKEPTIYFGSSPALYEHWLRAMIDWSERHNQPGKQIVFINAWNEWAEGAVLEPDKAHGRQFLEATRRALIDAPLETCSYTPVPCPTVAQQLVDFALDSDGNLLEGGARLRHERSILGCLEKYGQSESGFYIEGWAFLADASDSVLRILVFDEQNLVGSSFTSVYRSDLAEEHGLSALRSGFSLYMPAFVRARGRITVVALTADGGYRSLEVQTKKASVSQGAK